MSNTCRLPDFLVSESPSSTTSPQLQTTSIPSPRTINFDSVQCNYLCHKISIKDYKLINAGNVIMTVHSQHSEQHAIRAVMHATDRTRFLSTWTVGLDFANNYVLWNAATSLVWDVFWIGSAPQRHIITWCQSSLIIQIKPQYCSVFFLNNKHERALVSRLQSTSVHPTKSIPLFTGAKHCSA